MPVRVHPSLRPLSLSLARFSSAAAVAVALAIATAPRADAAPAAWDVDGLTNGVLTSGSGLWDDGITANFTNLTDSLAHFAWSNAANVGDTAFFGGTGGVAPFTITIQAAGINAAGVQFDTAGYTLAGGTLNLGAAGTLTANAAARINSVVAGTGGLVFNGTNTLVLAGANTFTGPLQINSGMIALNNATALGAIGAGNETVVAAGATLNLGGQAYGNLAPTAAAEIIQIAGAGVGSVGALINTGTSQNNATSKIVLTADATVGAGSGISTSFNAGGGIVTSAGGRFDVRLNAAPTAGQAHLDLAGFTLTKRGSHQLALVNADISSGNIVVDEGHLYFEAGAIAQGTGTVTVNPNGKFGWWAITNAANITRAVSVAGGTVGDITATNAAQTVNSPITVTGAFNPNFTATSTTAGVTTTIAGVISESAFTGTEIAKRGAGILAFSNVANTFASPLKIYQGTLRGDFTTTLSGGVPPAAPLTTTDTPLGTNATITLAGGTLSVRANMDNSTTQQVFDLQRAIVVDLAPGGMAFDRIGNTAQADKHVRINSLTLQPASAANGFSIGQNQFTFTQGNTHRLEIPLMTMNGDTVVTTGDHTFSGNILSAVRSSLVRTAANTTQFIAPATQQFNAYFNTAGSLRVGSGFGTPTTSSTVTAGSGAITIAPGSSATWRTPTNIAIGQIIDATVSQRLALPVVNFEQFTGVPESLRALGGGVLGIGNATAFGTIDFRRLGDGTWRLGAGLVGSGVGTITGTITPGAGNVVRTGATSTVTATAANAVSGNASLEVGAPLLNNAQATSSTGTFVLTAANNYAGGTTVNRGSMLAFQDLGALGSGAVTVFGTLIAQGAGGTFTADGTTNAFTPTVLGGSTIHLNNGALTGTTDVNRWGDTAPVALNASAFTLTSRNDNASTTTEQVGAVSFTGGSTINLNRQNAVTGNNVQLNVDALARTGTGTLEIVRSTGTGANFGSANVLRFTGIAPTLTNGIFDPHVTLVDGTRLVNFASYDGGLNAVVNAAYTQTVNTAAFTAGLAAGTDIVYADFAAAALTATLADNPDIYALKVGAGQAAASATTIAVGGGTSIRIRSGGLIVSGDTTTGNFSNAGGTLATINPALNFNDGTANIEAKINVRAATTATLNGAITSAGLTKFGGGLLQLTAANAATISGPVSVNGGTLELRTIGAAGSGVITLAGAAAQLNVRINGAAATYLNGITLAAGVPLATLDVGNLSTASNASALTFNGPAAGSPGLVLGGSPGAQGQTFTLQTNGNGTGSSVSNIIFAGNMASSIAGSATFNITGTRTLQFDNGPTITGTTPVITKAGDGTIIWSRVSGAAPVSPGTTVVVNAGTLDLRSITAIGGGGVGNTSFVLNGGTLVVRRDLTATYGGGVGVAYPVTIAGTSTYSSQALSTGTNQRLQIGRFTFTNPNATLTITNTSGFSADIQGATLGGRAFISSAVAPGDQDSAARFLTGFDVNGGQLVKSGTGHLHILSSNNTYDGGTYVQQGILRLRAAGAAGTGAIYLNPGATLDFNNALNLGATQPVFVRGNGAHLPMLSVNADGVLHPTANVDTSAAPTGIVGLSNGTAGNYSATIDLSALYGGGWSLGGVPTGSYDPIFTGSSIVAGNGNLYRFGGGGTALALGVDAARTAVNNVLTGPNDVRLGFDSGNILVSNGTIFQWSLAGVNDFSGGETTVHRGMVARLFSNNDGTRSGLSNSAIDVFGVFSLSGAASLDNGTGHVNAVTLHPGSALFLDNTNGAANVAGAFVANQNVLNRWNDATPIALNGAMLNLIGASAVASSETVGDVTYSRGARLRAQLTGTGGTATLTLNNLFGAGPGNTLTLATSAAGTLGVGDRILVTNAPPPVTNNMVTPSIVNLSDNTFVTYGANGFANIAYDATAVGNNTTPVALAAGFAATTKLDVTTGTVFLSDNPTIYALRTSQTINLGGPFNTLTLRSGGLIGTGGTINPHVVFNDGAANIEARIFTTGTLTLAGTITAQGVTKFGAGNLTIAVPQPGYASGWTVNSGTLQINDPQGLGASLPGNGVVLNGSLTTGGLAPQAFATQTTLNFNRDNGTPELVTFTGGPITVVNEGTIRIGSVVNDRAIQIPAVTLDSTGAASSVSLTVDVPFSRVRHIVPSLTLMDDGTIRIYDAGNTVDTGRVVALAVNSLVGTGKNLVKLGNRTLELPADNSATFTDGSITVSQGTVRVRVNGALGSASTNVIIEPNATLEIDTDNFTPTASVTQRRGSIERWNRETARGTSYTLPAGVNLQLNANLLAARTIGLTGGTIEGFLWIDHPAPAVERLISSAVTINLLADSFVGQNILQGQGYDAGRLPTVGNPFGDTTTGAYLRIDALITGDNLTKTGLDTVTLGNPANSYANTTVEMGTLRLGANNALPTSGALTTRTGGVFDLYGFNATVAGLGTIDGGPNPGGTGPGAAGRIVNSAPVDRTLLVNNSADYTYAGVIERNVALAKSGLGKLSLSAANPFLGTTTVFAGTLAITGSLSGTPVIDVQGGATLDVSGAASFTLGALQTLQGSGTVRGAATIAGTVAPGGAIGDLTFDGALTFVAGSRLSLELNGSVPGTGYDQITITATGGPLTIAAGTIALTLGYAPAPDASFTVIDNVNFSIIGGTFTNLPDGAIITADYLGTPYQFTADYEGGDGNDLVLTIPEPGALSAALAGLALLSLRRRRK